MNRKKRNSIVVVHEGYREGYFVEYISQFSPLRVNLQPCYGESATHVLNMAFKRSDLGLRVVAFFDEDFEGIEQRKIESETFKILSARWGTENEILSSASYKELQGLNSKNKNPVLAVSNPQSIEGLILTILDVPESELEGKSTNVLKGKLDVLLNKVVLKQEDVGLIALYDEKIAKHNAEIQKLLEEEPKNNTLLKYHNGKKQEFGRKKNEVIFKRFLANNISLEILQNKRVTIKSLDILLSELGI